MDLSNNTIFLKIKPEESSKPILAMAFINVQPLDKFYSLENAFDNGTLFENLNKPYYGGIENEK